MTLKQFETFATQLHQLLGTEDYRKLESSSYMPLCIERIAPDVVALCHVGEQNGDVMRDPEVVFRFLTPHVAEPISFRNDYVASYREVYTEREDGKILVNLREQKDLCSFCRMWFQNLKEQGFFDAAQAA